MLQNKSMIFVVYQPKNIVHLKVYLKSMLSNNYRNGICIFIGTLHNLQIADAHDVK